MTLGIGGTGYMGLAVEATLGTSVPPTKFFPIRSESLQLMEDKIYRTNIRGVADRSGAVKGYTHIEGDVVFEVTSDVLVYFLYAARMKPTKTGAMAPFTYTFTGDHVANPSTAAGATNKKTLSLYVERDAFPRTYAGCSVGQLAFSLDNGLWVCTASIMGLTEATATHVAGTFTASDPYGPGENQIQVPTATVRADADSFTLTVNDNLTPAFRLNGQQTPAYLVWGEREITAGLDIDYSALTDYNAFIAQTFQAITWKSINTAGTDEVDVLLNCAVTDSYQVNLGSLGDLTRAAVAYHGIYNTTDAALFTINTAEAIT